MLQRHSLPLLGLALEVVACSSSPRIAAPEPPSPTTGDAGEASSDGHSQPAPMWHRLTPTVTMAPGADEAFATFGRNYALTDVWAAPGGGTVRMSAQDPSIGGGAMFHATTSALMRDASASGAAALFAFDESHIASVEPEWLQSFDGSSWTRNTSLPKISQPYESVWVAAPGDLWLAGGNGDFSVLRINALESDYFSSQADRAAFQQDSFHAIWGVGPKDVWAGGDRGLYHYDGQHWTRSSDTKFAIRRISGTASSDVWAAGDGGVLHWDGTSWRPTSATTRSYRSVHARASNDVWAVGDALAISHFDGGSWSDADVTSLFTLETMPHGAPTLRGVWAVSTNEVWVVGGGPKIWSDQTNAVVLHLH